MFILLVSSDGLIMHTGDPICCVITYNTMVTSFSLNMEAMSGRWRGVIKGGFYERNEWTVEGVTLEAHG